MKQLIDCFLTLRGQQRIGCAPKPYDAGYLTSNSHRNLFFWFSAMPSGGTPFNPPEGSPTRVFGQEPAGSVARRTPPGRRRRFTVRLSVWFRHLSKGNAFTSLELDIFSRHRQKKIPAISNSLHLLIPVQPPKRLDLEPVSEC
mgnify:CR=1 FL=1